MPRHSTDFLARSGGMAGCSDMLWHTTLHKTPIQWTKLEEKAYQALNVMLSQAPVVQILDWTRDFHVFVNASDIAIGSMLTHPETLDKDRLLRALSLWEIDPKAALSLVWDGMTTLELVHTDICEPMLERSLGCSIRSKDTTLEVFSWWLAEVENLSGHGVKTLWSENGGEYTYWAFK